MFKSTGLMAAFFLLLPFLATAQSSNGTIKGFVYDKKTGEPMIYTNVSVTNAKTGVQTDVNGYFSISLPPGSYRLLVTTIGYDSSVTDVNLLPEAIVSKKILLTRQEVELKGIEVSGRKTEKITHINTGVTTVTPRQLKMLPSAGGEPDVAQYLQVIPGVVFTGDQGGQLYIRGGAPSQVGIYLDGVTIYNPFHSIGLFSVFETEAIKNVDVYTAGFNAQYGNRTAAIVDVHTRDGNKNKLSGLVSASPIMSRVMLEGPLVKSKKDNGSGVTFLVTGKQSYIDQTTKAIYSGMSDQLKNGLPFQFRDLYGKVTFNGDNGSKLNVFGFSFDDRANLLNDTTGARVADYKWKTTGGGATFVVSPSNTSALIDGKFAYSNYDISLDKLNTGINDTTPSTSKIGGFEAAINFTYFLQNYSQLKYGVEVNGINTSLTYKIADGVTATQDRQSTIASLYFMYRHNFSSKFIFEPSLRTQYYSEISKFSPEPRLGIKYNISESVRFKSAAGIYSQNIMSTKSDIDIVNLFTGFLMSPDQQYKNANGDFVKSTLQKSYHLVAGVEVDVQRVELNAEPWIKYFPQVNELNRNKSALVAGDPDFAASNGVAGGIDLSAKYSHDRVYLWVAMGYQKVTYTGVDAKGQKQTYPTPFDTRYNSNVVASYTAGKKKDWELSTRFNFRAPFPFTQTQGYYENANMTGQGIATNPLVQNGSYGVLYSDIINGGRLSYFHRLDVSAKKKFTINERSKLEATVAITNVYNRQNIFYVDRITNGKEYQLPFFPSANLTWSF
ncbi:MAG: carboxypeptidase-like regulatory domain-containing protein [Flavipsychrobacter sp.]|nr:carboxypeptidase-like regulatory domain-containing protein [Flavipsychrobacter sp.]